MSAYIRTLTQLENFIAECNDGDIFYILDRKYQVVGKTAWEEKNNLSIHQYLCANSINQLEQDGIVKSLPIKVAVCGILQVGNRYVCVGRKDGTGFGLIGGKVDSNETVYQAIVRECQEETGFNVSVDFAKSSYVEEDTTGYLTHAFCLKLKTTHGDMKEGEVPHLFLYTKQQILNESVFKEYNENAFDFFNL